MPFTGNWADAAGATMTLNTPSAGQITGTYTTSAGTFNLAGTYDTGNSTLGFSVTWNNGTTDQNSTTTWCGQYFNSGGAEGIITTWLLCTSTQPTGAFLATLVGQDVYARSQSSAAELKAKPELNATPYKRRGDK